MAIYHLSVKTISRSAGRSATAAAAYRSASMIHDERTGLTHDYRQKQGVISASIITPDGAPDWASDRAQLWNQAEATERRKNSVTAREFEVSLPSELSPEARSELAHQFAAELSERHQVAVDIALHAPGKEGDDRNHHAHLLLTTRTLGPDGFGKKTRELDARKSGEVARWRERWADLVNGKLEQAGLSIRVDHRSHKDRGIEDEPTIHVGPTATTMERQGEQTNRGDLNRAIQERNQRRRSAARELAEAEDEYKTAQRRSQQAREQAKRQQAPGPAPTHGSAALAQDAQPAIPAHLAAIADSLAAPSIAPKAGPGLVTASDEVLRLAKEKRQQAEQKQRQEAERKQRQQDEAAREREKALDALAQFEKYHAARASEIKAKALAVVAKVEITLHNALQDEREHQENKPQSPGMVARMFGASSQYRRDLDAWQSRADSLADITERVRGGLEIEKREVAEAEMTAARVIGSQYPDWVMLADKGLAIRNAERQQQEEEARQQRQQEEEARRQRERERIEARRREREEAKRKQAEYEAKWAERAVARLLTHVVDNPKAQLRVLEDKRRSWARQEPPGGESRQEWREYGAVLDARIKSLKNGQEHQQDQAPDRPRSRPRGPRM